MDYFQKFFFTYEDPGLIEFETGGMTHNGKPVKSYGLLGA